MIKYGYKMSGHYSNVSFWKQDLTESGGLTAVMTGKAPSESEKRGFSTEAQKSCKVVKS